MIETYLSAILVFCPCFGWGSFTGRALVCTRSAWISSCGSAFWLFSTYRSFLISRISAFAASIMLVWCARISLKLLKNSPDFLVCNSSIIVPGMCRAVGSVKFREVAWIVPLAFYKASGWVRWLGIFHQNRGLPLSVCGMGFKGLLRQDRHWRHTTTSSNPTINWYQRLRFQAFSVSFCFWVYDDRPRLLNDSHYN